MLFLNVVCMYRVEKKGNIKVASVSVDGYLSEMSVQYSHGQRHEAMYKTKGKRDNVEKGVE
jgi:hypothetical protein